MIHICFAYICRYKALRNVGLKIDSRYNYRFDAVNNVLSISEDENYPNRFWGSGLYSLAAIVGNNGAGKSTSMEFILNTLMEGANTHEIEGVLVYEQDGKLLVWGKNIEVNTTLPFSIVSNIPKITCFYYCGHFMPYVSYSNLRSTELAGGYNASDGWLLVKDHISDTMTIMEDGNADRIVRDQYHHYDKPYIFLRDVDVEPIILESEEIFDQAQSKIVIKN